MLQSMLGWPCVVLSWNPEDSVHAGWTFVLEPRGWMIFRPETQRLDGPSSWNPEAGRNFVLEPGGWMDFRPRTRRLDGLASWNSEVGFLEQCLPLSKPRSVFQCVVQLPLGRLTDGTRCVRFNSCIMGSNGTVALFQDPEMLLGPEGRFWSPEAALDPEVTFRTRRFSKDPKVIWEPGEVVLNPEVSLDPEVVLTRRYLLDPEVVLNPEVILNPEVVWEPGGFSGPGGRFELGEVVLNPKVVWEPEGSFWTRRFLLDPEIVLNPEVALDPKVVLNPGLYKNLEVYLFQALRSFQDPETAWGPEGTVLRLPRQDYSRYLFGFRILPLGSWPLSRMDAGVRAGASLNRNLEACVLPEAWMIFPNQFAPYFSISSSNSGNNLCTQVLLWFVPCSDLEENKFPRDRPESSRCFRVLRGLVALSSSLWLARDLMEKRSMLQWALIPACRWQVDLPREIQDPGLACRWMARIVGLAGEDHLYQLKSAVGDLLPRSEVGILDLGFALQ
ncbi:hypothetical protein F2Q68_00004634 [Brassica cretica]|uniref:Uncharacterized protein n=1 Tax=Brassica cretica TaxID=69181 RepID=A0A8S9J7G0_BRACR|nr:hypothetical protein F2Q68_00004634 [Brassica cretica]